MESARGECGEKISSLLFALLVHQVFLSDGKHLSSHWCELVDTNVQQEPPTYTREKSDTFYAAL